MTEFEKVNFFTNREVQDDPYQYFDWVREQGPVWQESRYGVFKITGHPEAMAVYGDPAAPTTVPSGATVSVLAPASSVTVKRSAQSFWADVQVARPAGQAWLTSPSSCWPVARSWTAPAPVVRTSATERFPVNAEASCPFVSPVVEDFGPVKIRDLSMAGAGLLTSRRVEPGTMLAITLANTAKGFSKTVVAKVIHATPVPGSCLLGVTFTTPLTYQEMSALVL